MRRLLSTCFIPLCPALYLRYNYTIPMDLYFLSCFNTLYITNRYQPVPLMLFRSEAADGSGLWELSEEATTITMAEKFSKPDKFITTDEYLSTNDTSGSEGNSNP